jgi:hypothetical protein
MIRCHERDVPLAFELAGNLAAQGPLIVFDGQTDVGPLGEAPSKNACVVCSASAWITTITASAAGEIAICFPTR